MGIQRTEKTVSQRRLCGESGIWVRPWNLDIIYFLEIENRILDMGIWFQIMYADNQLGGSTVYSYKEGLKYRLKNLKVRLRVHPVVRREWFIHKPLFRPPSFLTCAIKSSIMIGTISVLCISVSLASGQGLAHHMKHSGNVCWITK